MASGHKGKSEQRRGKASRRRPDGRHPVRLPLAAHPAFAPLLGVWGALLGAGVVVVLPAAMVEQMLRGTLIGTWAAAAQPTLAWVVGGLLGIVLFAFAAFYHVSARRDVSGPSIAEMAARRVTPINPARDLGSRRLDDPVETMPFSTPAWRDADADADAGAGAVPSVAEPEAASAPRELDLAAFAELPGRNAVWVEEPAPAASAPEPAPAPLADTSAVASRAASAPLPVPGSAALARLRAVPTSQLSLAEMVERFAGALHEMREGAPGRNLGPGDLAAREAALAEALRALEALSGKGRPAPRLPRRDEPLHAVRARLQPHPERVRGAA
ncbi:hypothetical protein [Erythrobacter donghaensis]|jgi:hypothetical protein|uniref:hypothetical protein n=1 Tax=Erythrobacter donghaensis TaxID=267135 RepID=UPI00093B08BF|nr:hypothetical protein [Erythrobacter donghaensis]